MGEWGIQSFYFCSADEADKVSSATLGVTWSVLVSVNSLFFISDISVFLVFCAIVNVLTTQKMYSMTCFISKEFYFQKRKYDIRFE